MEKFIATKHIGDRMERMLFIAKNIGWGEIILKSYCEERGHIECITDTGILLIKSEDCRILVTAYPISLDKAFAIYASEGKTMPSWLKLRIIKNEKIKKKFGFRG